MGQLLKQVLRSGFDRLNARLVRLMWIGKTFETENDKWRVQVVRSALPGHLSGWLINKASGNRYVFSRVNGKIRYMREYKPPTNIPKYVDEFILSIGGAMR